MAFVLEMLKKAQVWVPVEWGEDVPAGIDPAAEPPQIAFNPTAWTNKYAREFASLNQSQADEATVRAWFDSTLPRLLVDWSIFATEEDEKAGRPLPISFEGFDLLPTPVMRAIFKTIGKAVGTDFTMRAAKTNSTPANGSRSGARTANGSTARRKRTSGS